MVTSPIKNSLLSPDLDNSPAYLTPTEETHMKTFVRIALLPGARHQPRSSQCNTWKAAAAAIGFILLAAPLCAQTAVVPKIDWKWGGSKTQFRNHPAWFMFIPRWAVPVTCSTTTNRCTTASDYVFTNDEIVYFASTGTLPSGVWGETVGYNPSYAICNFSGGSFELHQGTCAGPLQTYGDTGTGTLYLQLTNAYSTPGCNFSVSGYPAGSTISWYRIVYGDTWEAHNPPNAIYNCGVGTDAWILQIDIPPGAALGDYTLAATATDTGTSSKTYTVNKTITVVADPTFTPSAPSSYPAIPGLSFWQQLMTADYISSKDMYGGGHYCTPLSAPVPVPANWGMGWEGAIWFYDGAHVFQKIANYTGDSRWLACASSTTVPGIADAYASYIIGAGGMIAGYRHFPIGLAESYVRTGTAALKTAFDLLKSGGTVTAFYPSDYAIRESSYSLEYRYAAEKIMGYPRDPLLVRHAEFILSMLLDYVDGVPTRVEEQQFYDGLAMTALIHYYELTSDARVPYVVKRVLDHMWSTYNATTHALMWNPDPEGPHCQAAPQWFNTANVDDHCQDSSGSVQALGALVVNAFGWYWSVTGDDTYRTRGDEIFQHVFDTYGSVYVGKQFAQSYKTTFDYVAYRTNPTRDSFSGATIAGAVFQ